MVGGGNQGRSSVDHVNSNKIFKNEKKKTEKTEENEVILCKYGNKVKC